MFITFEGGEGCGKSTQSKLLAKYLKKLGFSVLVTKEPGGTALGNKIRNILLGSSTQVSTNAELFLFAADRSQHVETVIKPALKAGKIVICDRYIDSTVAYQIGGRGLPEDLVRYLNTISSDGLIPDLTILLDLGIERGKGRVKQRNLALNRFEKERSDFHKRVKEEFLVCAKNNPKRIAVVDSSESIKKTQAKIVKIVKERLEHEGF